MTSEDDAKERLTVGHLIICTEGDMQLSNPLRWKCYHRKALSAGTVIDNMWVNL